MTKNDRVFLASVCGEIQGRFPNVVAAFEGFVTPSLGGGRDGFLSVELFNVPLEAMEEVLSFAEALAHKHLMSGGAFVTFSPWTPEETAEHFLQDVAVVTAASMCRWSMDELGAPWEDFVECAYKWLSATERRTESDDLTAPLHDGLAKAA